MASIPSRTISTDLTDLLNIKYPVMSAGMGSVSMHELVAAVSNAGGIGSLGGVSMTPKFLRKELSLLKKLIKPGAPFGVDLLLPQVGGSARKTNKDYTEGKLPELIDVIIEEKVPLFISAVGVPPKWAVDKLHKAGIVVMNMVGKPHHVQKALEVGCDGVIAQGYEAGGHTGDVATMPLIPQCVDMCRGKRNYFGKPVVVVAAGGIFDGRGVAAALSLGASGVWVGTRFVASAEASASKYHKKLVCSLASDETVRTLIATGRPLRVARTEYVMGWENRPNDIRELTSKGIIPMEQDFRQGKANARVLATTKLLGQACGAIKDVKPAAEIVYEMVNGAIEVFETRTKLISRL